MDNYFYIVSLFYLADGHSVYEEIYKYKTQLILPERMIISSTSTKQEEKKKKEALKNFKKVCKSYKNLLELEEESQSRLPFCRKNDKEYIIPYDLEISNLIFQAHRGNSNHYDAKNTAIQLKAMGVF